MKNKKKIIGTINELPQFPKILNEIETMLSQGNGDYILILDGTNYSDSISLLDIVIPDMLLLNLKLAGKEAIKLNDLYMENTPEMRLGIITNDPGIYYVSLCSTLGSHYSIDNPLDVELIAANVTIQQLN
jgi:hypothetical protein